MKILFFDTETTGFVSDIGPLEKQPYLIQLGAILGEYSDDGTVLNEEKIDLLFKSGVPIPKQATDVHGITDSMVKDKEFFFESYIKDFIKISKEVDFIVGHNVEFDRKMIFVEADRRYSESEEKKQRKKMFQDKCVCTMKISTTLVGIPGKFGGFKFPKLAELHTNLFNEDFDNAHNAFADIEATARCFRELNKRGLLSYYFEK